MITAFIPRNNHFPKVHKLSKNNNLDILSKILHFVRLFIINQGWGILHKDLLINETINY